MRRFGILAGIACLLVLGAASISWAQSDPPAAATISSITPGYQSLTVDWEIPSDVDDADITAFELRHIESAASDKTDNANWTLTEDLTSRRSWGILEGLTNGTQYDVQARVVTNADGAWSSTSTGTPASPGTSSATATELAPNIGVVGYLSSSTDSDYFKFELSTISEVLLFTAGPYNADGTLASGSVDTAGTLYDSSQTLIQNADSERSISHGMNNFFIPRTLNSGTYYVKVNSNVNDIGTYRLFYRTFNETTGISNARTVELGRFYSGVSSPGNNLSFTDEDYFRLELASQTSVYIYTHAEFDSVIDILNSVGTAVLSNDDGFQYPHAMIVSSLDAGTYFIKISRFGQFFGRFYNVYLEETSDIGSTIGTATPIELSKISTGEMATSADVNYLKFSLSERTGIELNGLSSDTDQLTMEAQFLDSSETKVDNVYYAPNSIFEDTGKPEQLFHYNGILDAGDYYIKLTSTKGVGSYAIQLIPDSSSTAFDTFCSGLDSRVDAPNDRYYGCQWHLNNTNQFGAGGGQDINVESVWNTATGAGINVAIVDSGLDTAHPDLKDNILTANNYDYNGNNNVFNLFRYHGTLVAGIVAASHNDIGVRGVAPQAKIYGYNLLDGTTTHDRIELSHTVDAMLRNMKSTAVSNNSWGTGDDGSYYPISILWERAVEQGVTEGFDGKGTVYVWSAGNGSPTDNSNLNGYNSFYGITSVCAVDYNDVRSSYSEVGANLWICAPSDGRNAPGITTTDNLGKYASSFGGTSAATPIVSGVVALVRSANLDLTWRDVKLILAASARKNDPTNTGWVDAGLLYGSDTDRYHFNHEYGFGMVDADAAVELANDWTNVPSMRETTVNSSFPRETLPDKPPDNANPYTTKILTVDSSIEFTEFVEINVNFTHPSARDLDIVLVSPSGAESQLATSNDEVPGAFEGTYRFGSARHLGEDPSGDWELRVKDSEPGDTGTLRSWSITVYGHRTRPAEPKLSSLTAGDESVAVTWSAPSDIGASEITSYDLRYIRTDATNRDDSNWDLVQDIWETADPVPALEYDLTGLSNNVSYDIALRAVNDLAAGTWSDSSSAMPFDPLSPRVSGNQEIDYLETRTTSVASFTATNPNSAPSVTFSVSGQDSGDFEINPSGELTFANQPDYEIPADANRDNVYHLDVEATDGTYTGALHVVVTVIEVDEPPDIVGLDNPTYREDRTGPVTTYTAIDPEDSNAKILWSLTGTDSSDFEIDEDDGVLTFANQPDYEIPADADRDNQYLITVQAEDETGHTGQFAVTVGVEDFDEPPEIVPGLTEISYREDRTTTVATYRATDPEGAEISWDLSGDDDDDFEINASGVLSFANQPDYENPADADRDRKYEVTVEATDETNNTGEFMLTVVVTDFDEPPDLSPEDNQSDYPEDETGAVEIFRATDPEGESITWDLSGTDRGDFEINNGTLTFADQPDYETPDDANRDNIYQVTVEADDGTKTSRSNFTITVGNIEENGSVDLSSVQPQEGTQLQASASDPDKITSTITWTWHRRNGISNCPNGTNSWSLIGGATTSTYTPVTGDVDCGLRATASYTDGHGPSKTAQAISDNPVQAAPVVPEPPVFPSGDYTREVLENTPAGRDIGSPVAATDENTSDTLTYTLRTADAVLFDIVENSGQIRTKTDLNYESRQQYTVVVTATDPSGLFDTQQVTINVSDEDEDPVVTSTSSDTTVRFDENSTRSVASYRATDPERETVTWTLSGSDGTAFNISANGVLSFIAPPDYEQPSAAIGNEYLVTIVATESDTTLPINTGRLVVTVIVDDVDEPPVIGGLDNVSYREDRTDLSVGVYRGTDPENAHVSDWRLTGSDSRHFEITDGELTFKEQPNYETRTNYRVTVHATDRTNHTGSLAVVINVTDVDEPPVITGPDEVSYSQDRTDTVARYQAVDPERAVITWDLVGAHSGEFDFVNGVLTFKDQPFYDANGNNEYFVTVRATDQTGNTGELQVIVTVTESGQPRQPQPQPRQPQPQPQPEETEPEETEPEDTEPEDTEPEDTEPEDTEPEDTEPEDTEPEDTEEAEPDRPVRVAACDLDPSSSTQPFSDLSDSSFAFNDVGCLVALEVTKGTSETTYSPGQAVTREQMAAFIARLYKAITKEPAPLSETPFTDVAPTSFAYDDISRVFGLGITKGTSETTYSPQQTVTREQMAAFIARLYKAITKEPAPLSETPFTDVAPTSFAYDDIGRIFGLGITKGTSETTYSPQQTVTREQMAAFIARLYRTLTSPST